MHTRTEGTDPTSLTNAIMGKCSFDDGRLPPLTNKVWTNP